MSESVGKSEKHGISRLLSCSLLEEIFAVSRKIEAIVKIKFPRKIIFWTIRENNSVDIRKNKFLDFLNLFVSIDDYNTLQHIIKWSLMEYSKWLD